MKRKENLMEIHENALKKIRERDTELKQLLEEKKKFESQKSTLNKKVGENLLKTVASTSTELKTKKIPRLSSDS